MFAPHLTWQMFKRSNRPPFLLGTNFKY